MLGPPDFAVSSAETNAFSVQVAPGMRVFAFDFAASGTDTACGATAGEFFIEKDASRVLAPSLPTYASAVGHVRY